MASVLHLGNIHFAADEESNAQVTTENQLKYLTRVSRVSSGQGQSSWARGRAPSPCAPLLTAPGCGWLNTAGSPDTQEDHRQGRGGEAKPLPPGGGGVGEGSRCSKVALIMPLPLVCSAGPLSTTTQACALSQERQKAGSSERHRELAKVTQEEGDGIRLEPRLLPLGMRPLVPIPPSRRCGHCVLSCGPSHHTPE